MEKGLTDLEVVPRVGGDGPPGEGGEDPLVEPRRLPLGLRRLLLAGGLPFGSAVQAHLRSLCNEPK